MLDKDNNPKSKCIAFVEASDTELATFLIDNMNNFKLAGTKKGLILEFSLEDIRKKIKREKSLSERKSKIQDEKRKERKIRRQIKKETSNDKEDKETIENIKDVPKLLEIYHSTDSRGKKQRIKKKIARLGFNPESLDFTQKNKNSAFAKKPIKDTIKTNDYVVTKINLGEKRNKKLEDKENVLKRKRKRKDNDLTKKENNRRRNN